MLYNIYAHEGNNVNFKIRKNVDLFANSKKLTVKNVYILFYNVF